MTLWLYLHFESLQLDSLEDEKESAPIVVADPKTHRIVQMCERAKQCGVKVGAGLASTAALCDNLQIVPYDEQRERSRLQEIADWLYLVTADISLFPPNGILLKVSNMLALYKSLEDYWQQIQSHLLSFGLRYSYSTGFSPLAARLLARNGLSLLTDDKQKLLQQVKLNSLKSTDLPEATCERLQRVRVTTLAQLIDIPITQLAKRFDAELVLYLGRLQGQLHHPIIFYVPCETFSRYLVLLYELETIQWLTKPLYKLLQQLESFLLQRNKLAELISIQLHFRDADVLKVDIAFAQGESKASAWLELIELKLSTVQLPEPVQGVTLSAEQFISNVAQNNDLFQGTRTGMPVSALIAKLEAKLGPDALHGFSLNADPRPECAFELSRPLSKSAKLDKKTHLKHPSMLLPYTIPLTEKVDIFAGPERIYTGWWGGKALARDYFIARNEQGQWLWVYKNATSQWLVHGYF